MNLADLQTMDRAALEALYVSTPLLPLPAGQFRGAALKRIPFVGWDVCFTRVIELVAFDLMPWGIDLDSRSWYFFCRCLQIAHFNATPGPSRWRATDAIALDYSVSGLPWFLRNYLYDEIKPLSNDLCLGIGGSKYPAGVGDHMFFGIERVV